MLNLAPSTRVFLCTRSVDLRKSFDTLAQLVREFLEADPLSGHLFVFRNRRGDRVKILYWDEDGYAIWYKRFEVGTFRVPKFDPARVLSGHYGVTLRSAELAMLLDGVDLENINRRKRYQRLAIRDDSTLGNPD